MDGSENASIAVSSECITLTLGGGLPDEGLADESEGNGSGWSGGSGGNG